MPSWEPVPGYDELCTQFRAGNNSRDCMWNVITTVWETRGIKVFGGNGSNNMVIRVDHIGIREDSATYEKAVSTVSNRVFKREFVGQAYDFFASSLVVNILHKKMMGEAFIGQVQLGIMDVFLSAEHMLPMQWFPIVDPNSDLPAEPMGYIKMNCIINNLQEPGAVQQRAPDDVADWELNRQEILQIPRLNLRKVACHQYNLKFNTYQGFDLGTGEEFTADPVFKVYTPCGVIASDPFPNSLKPQWNVMLQIPFYEPTFCDLIVVEVWDGNTKAMSRMMFSWKDLVIRQDYYATPRWLDMYERKYDFFKNFKLPIADVTVDNLVEQAGIPKPGGGMFEERSIYCGRVLLSMEIEERSEKKEPSPAAIQLKPKDCIDMWSDAKQKMFFRFHCFFGQDFAVDGWKSSIQVEFCVGRKTVLTRPVQIGDRGLYEFFESVELEYELPFDDLRDNPPPGGGKPSEGSGLWSPGFFIARIPDVWVKVYKVSMVSMLMKDREMIGMWRGTVPTVLGGGDAEMYSENVFIGSDKNDNLTGAAFEGVQSIMIAPGDESPGPTKRAPWGNEQDERTRKILNPYTGYQYVELHSDASCGLGPDEPAGFIGFSTKLWMPTREKCANGPPKGPPVLSPWKAWGGHMIPPPWSDLLKWYRNFNIRAHIYQAKSLPARNETGVANAYVELRYLLAPPVRTHVAYLTNNPTFDTTLNLMEQEIYILPSDPFQGADMYCVDAEDSSEVEENWEMLRLAPRFEIRVYEEVGETTNFLGRAFISASEVFSRKVNPEYISLFKGNPDVVEGYLLCSFQVIEQTEKLMKEPPSPLVPDRSMVNRDDSDTWTSKAPIKSVPMMECKILIQVLGLRDLSSPYPTGLPIAAPQVEICCDDPKTASTTKTCSRPPGTDANFMQCVEIDVSLPEDRRYAPFLDFYVYDHSTMGLGFELPWNAAKPPIVAYGSMATEDFYPSDKEDDDGDDDEDDEEDEEAQEKRRQKERKKKFEQVAKELKKDGVITAKEAKMLDRLFTKKDEAVTRAFDQYIDAPDDLKFIERVESFLGEKVRASNDDERRKKEAAKQKEDKKKKKVAEDAKKKADAEAKKKAIANDGADGGGEGGEGGEGGDEGGDAGPDAGGALDKADAPEADDMEQGDGQGEEEEEGDDVLEANAVEGEDDVLPDKQEKVDTPDGKPNPEWLLLRAHPIYDCPLEHSTIAKYGKRGAWEPRFADAFDELVLFRGPIQNFKNVEAESVGILKCKIKLYRLEDLAEAEARGEEQRFLDMAELKKGKEVPYEVPDVNENFQSQNIEVRVYLLKAFQMTPCQVVDGVAKSDNFVHVTLGPEAWDWRTYFDPIVSLNPQFYKCAKIIAKLPGPSRLHVKIMDDADYGLLQPVLGAVMPEASKMIGETIIDLEDRWFCEEWSRKTVHKPRETRDLFNPDRAGISLGKLMMMIDAVPVVEADDKPEKDINIAGRQMPLEMRLIIWNLRNCAPKDGYTSDIKVFVELLGWGRVKETDVDAGVKVSRNAMFNYRIKFKGIKFPSPDPTIPAKDFTLKFQVWANRLLGNDELIAEGYLPMQPIFLDAMQRNLGKPSPDDMELVSLPPDADKDTEADEEGTKYPYKWLKLCHPGGPGCKTNKDFRQPGYDFVKNYQAEIQITAQVMPRAKARAMPASLGFKAGPSKLFDPNRPPQPTNPIFNPEGCKAYIVYVCKEAINKQKPCCCCLCCCLILVALLVGFVYLTQAVPLLQPDFLK